ncbi:MAG: ABC transporter ATP-binding protein, partial [Patescibacteria group bacterium]|nr:ABC transporter ATP-binding protein [Patescibacteria group bacterium]
MWTYLKELNKNEGTTIFFTTHYMEEAEQIAQRIAIIDNGKIIASGTPQELKQQESVSTLEEAFLSLTGKTIRDESANSKDRMRAMHRLHSKR